MSPEQLREGFEATYLKYLMKIYYVTEMNEEVVRPIYFSRSVYNNEHYSMLMVQEAWIIFQLTLEWSDGNVRKQEATQASQTPTE